MSKYVGQNVVRKEGWDKITGKAKYIDDLNFEGMIFGATIRSDISRGKITGIHFLDGVNWDEFTIVKAEDIPGENYFKVIENDQPFLAQDFVNHPGEPVVLIAHSDKHLLEKARSLVKIEVKPMPSVFDLEASLEKKEIIWKEDNILKSYLVDKGNVDEVWDTADYIIEGEYKTGAQEQLYIEPQGAIAIYDKKEGVTIWGSMQCPYYVHGAIKQLFKLEDEKVRIIQAETGGAFGGKEDYPSIISGHAALLAWKSGKPVKIIYSREEDLAVTTKRHPSRTKHKTAVDKKGKLLAMEIDFVLDGGAYATLSSVVLSRGTLHAAGPYNCDNVRIQAKAVATNTPPQGAFRGFGVPQSVFALERHMEKVAKEIGMQSDEFRKINFIKKGQTLAFQQEVREDVDLEKLLNKVFVESDYFKKLKQFQKENKANYVKKGIGFSVFMHGAGFTGSGEKTLASIAGLEIDVQGAVQVLAASTEMGQGARTVFAQIVADILGIHPVNINVATPDTNKVPNSGPTVASRTTMVVGKLVEDAAYMLKKELKEKKYIKKKSSEEEILLALKKYREEHNEAKFLVQYQQPEEIQFDDEKYVGDAYPTYAWAVYLAEVSVDTLTYETKVDNYIAAQEVGKVVNPILAEGQIEGGVVQGIGFALYEKVENRDGLMINNQMTNYVVPTAMDVPQIKVFFEEDFDRYGPQGAKGIGELPLDGSAVAVINAVENAIGRPIDFIPMLPEDLMKVMES